MFFFHKFSSLWDGVIAAAIPRMATAKTAKDEWQAASGAVPADALARVLGTGGMESAPARGSEEKQFYR
jgi:hypothetical protein